MGLEDFITKNKVSFTKNLISVEDITIIEEEIGVPCGKELRDYLLKYGYLAYKHVELYGVNSKQMTESDMIKQTKYLHKYFMKTSEYIALENMGDGEYVLVSASDDIFEYSSEQDDITKLDYKFDDYILKRFTEIDGEI